jgi:phytoene synthase
VAGAALAVTRETVMARQTSFYYAFLILPAAERRAIVAVWDFCRAVDDAIDEAEVPPGRASASEAVCFWREELGRCFNSSLPRTPQGRNLQPVVAEFQLPRRAFDDVIDGVAMDVERTRYQTFQDLYEYCRRVASAVGLICIRIFGCRGEQAGDYALNLGLALQLTNIIRDIGDDWRRGRLYLPLDDLAAFGCTEADLACGVITPPVRNLLAFECGRAKEFYGKAAEALPADDRRRLVAAEIMRAVYVETLCRIESRGYDVFTTPIRVPRVIQAMIALREWLWR